MRIQTLAAQFGWVSAGRIIAAALQAVSILILARVLGPALFGFFAAAQGVLLVVQAASGLGLGTLIVRERAVAAYSPLVPSALRANGLLTIALVSLSVVATVTLGLTLDNRFLALTPLAVAVAVERSADVWLGVAIADGNARVTTANLVARRFAACLLFVLSVWLTPMDPLLIFGTAMLAAAAGSWVASRVYVSRRVGGLVERVPLREVLTAAWPYWTQSIATQLRNLDTTVAALVTSPVQAGYFGVMSRTTGPLRLIPTSLATVLLPIAAIARPSDRVLRFVLFASSFALAFLYLGLALVAPIWVPLLLGPGYVEAIPVLQLGTASLWFAGMASLLTSALQGQGQGRFASYAAIAMTITCLVAIAALGPSGGAVGATIGLSLGYLVQFVLLAIRAAQISRAGPSQMDTD